MVREAKLGNITYETKMNKDVQNPIEGGMMSTICTIPYDKFDFQLKQDVGREPPIDDQVDGIVMKTTGCRADFEKMKALVEGQPQTESANKASAMHLSYLEHHGF